jgi:hypothetical protein
VIFLYINVDPALLKSAPRMPRTINTPPIQNNHIRGLVVEYTTCSIDDDAFSAGDIIISEPIV